MARMAQPKSTADLALRGRAQKVQVPGGAQQQTNEGRAAVQGVPGTASSRGCLDCALTGSGGRALVDPCCGFLQVRVKVGVGGREPRGH